jgi:hypothetical protein
MSTKTRSREKVMFRLIQMPCCGQLLCWVNPRLPTFCPECATQVYMKVKFDAGVILVSDENAWLEHST